MTKIEPHPLKQLQSEDIITIREYSAAAEKEGLLQPEQLAVVHKRDWFKMLVPAEYNGLELSLPDEVRLIEAISCADGSMGWSVTLCAGAGWFGGFLDPEVSREVFATPQVCLAGSGKANGTATITRKGYIVNGKWPYASGALHATHFTANCIIHDNNGPVLDADGQQTIKAFIFNSNDVTILKAWNYTGMVATGSHSFEVADLDVPLNRTFIIDSRFAVLNKPLYTYPFLQLAEATLAVNISGLAVHFIDLCEGIFTERRQQKDLTSSQSAKLDEVYMRSVFRMNDARSSFYQDVYRSWLSFTTNNVEAWADDLAAVSQSSRKLAKVSRHCVDDLYPYCGLLAANNTSEINRVWRDIHTASQHSLLTFDE